MSQQEISNQQIDALLEQITSESEKLRIQAVEGLASAYPGVENPDRRVLVGKAVLNSMGDKSWPVRQAATLILPHICESWAAEPLMNALVEFRYPVLKDSEKTEKCFEEISKAIVRVGTPALELMINFYLIHENKFKRHELLYWDPYPAKVVDTYFDSMGDVACKTLISMLSTQQNNDKIFHLLIKCGKAAEEPLLEFVKKQEIPSPTFLIMDEDKLVFRGLGAAALLGSKDDESYKKDFQWRLDKAQGSLAIPTPKIENDYKELFGGQHTVSPAMLTLITLKMEDCEKFTDALIDVLKQIGLPAVEVILPDLQSKNSHMRFAAVRLLGRIRHPAAIEALASSLAMPNANYDFQRVVITALGKIGGESVPGIILPYLKNTDFLVRETTAETLGDFKDVQVIDALLAALDDPKWQVRLAAVTSLGKIGDPRAVPSLIEQLSDKGGKILGMGKGVREFAADALEQIGTPEALNAVKDMKTKKR
jgi:HEAT repeat protein